MAKKVRRLQAQFQPQHYILDLVLDPEATRFNGTVIIAGQKIGAPSQRLTFHQKDLKITGANLTRHDKRGERSFTVSRINCQDSFDEVRLHTKETLYPGHYTVTLKFAGQITRPMNGLYPCSFTYKGKSQQLLATQFESHHAREVFPCIDEPAAKATFELSLTTPAGETVVSNTPIKKHETVTSKLVSLSASKKTKPQRTSAPAHQRTTFETTPKMSTYLLAFVVGNLKYNELKTRSGVVLRAYTTPDNIKFTDFALDVAVKCLEFFEDYFDLRYPLSKCDLVALPDFAAGAMENWGCITFREQAMFVDPANTSLSNKQYVAMVVAHELAHQWFGNLVTMHWWTDLWLNEGFASWIEYLAVDHLFPNWEMWTQFIVDEQQQALKLDALEHTHPIEAQVNHPDEIRTIFDAISYHKGASVIHMLHDYLGAEVFRDGLRYYLAEHQYSNTDTVDLWTALEQVADKPVRQFMHTWTTQPGFPLLGVTVDEHQVTAKQRRFYLNPKAGRRSEARWPVPIKAGGSLDSTLLDIDHATWSLPHDQSHLKLNRGQTGFYRVSYNASQLQKLAEGIKQGRFEPLDRLGLLSDAFEAAKAGQLDTIQALSLLDAYQDEANAAVWDIIASNLANVRLVMDDERLRDNMKPYMRQLVARQLKRLGWTGKVRESHFDKLLRPIVLGMATVAEEPIVVNHALKLFQGIKQPKELPPELRQAVPDATVRRGNEIDPDLRGVIYGTTARTGGRAEFDKLLAMHNATSSSEERNTLAAALTGFKQPELIERALDLITTDAVRLQDVLYWVVYSFLNHHAKRQAWDWLVGHWSWLSQNLENDISFVRFPTYAARPFSDLGFLKEYKNFFDRVMTPALERSVKQGIEIVEWQAAWKQRDLATIAHFFEANNKKQRTSSRKQKTDSNK